MIPIFSLSRRLAAHLTPRLPIFAYHDRRRAINFSSDTALQLCGGGVYPFAHPPCPARLLALARIMIDTGCSVILAGSVFQLHLIANRFIHRTICLFHFFYYSFDRYIDLPNGANNSYQIEEHLQRPACLGR